MAATDETEARPRVRDAERLLEAKRRGQPDKAQAELVAAYETLEGLGPAVSMFGSARTPRTDPDYKLARATARAIGEAGYAVITGGGPGIMEAANRGAKEAGVPSVGLAIDLPFEQKTNKYVDVPLVFQYFFTRKIFYVDPAEAFIIFPGGPGTMDEFFEVMTLVQTAKIPRYPLILADSDYWGGLVDWMGERVQGEGKLSKSDMGLIQMADTPEQMTEIVKNAPTPRRRPLRRQK